MRLWRRTRSLNFTEPRLLRGSSKRAVHVLGEAVDVARTFDHAWVFGFPVMLLVGVSHVDPEVLRLDRAE